MKELLTTNGGTFLDNEDHEYFKRWKWCKHKSGHVYRNTRVKGVEVVLFLHKEILKRAYDYTGEADHKNWIPWDNQKENLRPASRSQNQMNQGLGANNSTGYKGVHYDASYGLYKAEITVRGRLIHLGRFRDLIEAARAYDKAARRYHKEFAFLNFPEETQC